MHLAKITFTIVLFALLSNAGQGQKQNNNWFFGNRAGLNFSNGTPVSIVTSRMRSIEGCATVSDPVNGRLLFYTNGVDIWNTNHQVMANGSGLLGGQNTSSSQGVAIVPYPKMSSLYYVFTVDEAIGGAVHGFRYSIVDMRLDGGLGDVIPSQKNILINTSTTERLTVAKTADQSGYWILMHERNNNVFQAYLLNDAGLQTIPVSSSIGLVHDTIPRPRGNATMGCMQFNNTFTKLAVALHSGEKLEVFDFDNCSGKVSNPVTIFMREVPYGVCFSPDDSRLYYSLYSDARSLGLIYQINMAAANIAASVTLVGVSSSLNIQCVGSMQLAPDGNIYIPINGELWLSAITQPNNLGVACGFVDKGVTLLRTGLSVQCGFFGLPQSVLVLGDTLTTSSGRIAASNFCFSDRTQFSVTGINRDAIVQWNFGDSGSSVNTGNGLQTAHTFSDTGFYLVTAIVKQTCTVDTLTKNIRITGKKTSITEVKVCSSQLPYRWNGNGYNATGAYVNTLKDVNGCDSNAQLNLQVTQCDTTIIPPVIVRDCTVALPNVFSPNGDGVNEIFLPSLSCAVRSYELKIFTRWGQSVFVSNRPASGWNGRWNGSESPAGVYYYLLSVTFASGQSRRLSGYVTLLR